MDIQGTNYHKNPSHAKLLQRLNRISGQIEGIKKMIQEERYCVDILTQLHAARSALRNLEIQVFDDHLSQCALNAFEAKDPKQKEKILEEIRLIIKRFN